ncbi:condensation domain-containing protein, partial [Microbulbifer aggregans]|uniref:condensation domain-containing protein n=1 Tax=Microbulbifer aggregans TaxID=1769779 RepID=UPI001CFE785A
MLSLIKKLKRENVAVWASGDKLNLSYDGELQASILSELKESKEDLLSYLRGFDIFSPQDFYEFSSRGSSSALSIDHIFPATSLQQGFIYYQLNQPNDDAYRVQVLIDYALEAFDVDSYMDAWKLAALKFPILRTSFDWEDKDIFQVIHSGQSLSDEHFQFYDLSDLSQQERDSKISAIQGEDRRFDFDLGVPGLVRFHLLKHSADYYTVIKTTHHSISDGWSGPILMRTVHQYYDALVKGETPEVEEETA